MRVPKKEGNRDTTTRPNDFLTFGSERRAAECCSGWFQLSTGKAGWLESEDLLECHGNNHHPQSQRMREMTALHTYLLKEGRWSSYIPAL
jgi:hypothetical protein